MQVLSEEGWADFITRPPSWSDCNKLPGDAEAAGPWTALSRRILTQKPELAAQTPRRDSGCFTWLV